jgi:hypothetical protein
VSRGSRRGGPVETIRFDVYGRFHVIAERSADRVWTLMRRDGKRSPLTDVLVADGAPASDIVDALEATFHELGSPGRAISPID